jgi:hypothetical protein
MENTTVVEKPKSKTNKYLLAIAVVVVLILGLVAAIFLAQRNQNIKERASTPTGIAKVRLSPTTKTIEVGDEFESVIYFDTGGRAISAITVQLSYTYTGNEPPISTDDLIEIDSSLVLDSSWNFPIKTVTSQNGTTIIKIGGYNNSDSGFTSTGEQSLATLTFKGESSGSINVTFDSSVSKIAQKQGSQDILLTPASSGVYTVSGSTTTATATATSTSSATPSGTASTTPTSTSTTNGTGTSGSTITPQPVPQSGISLPSTLGIILGTMLVIGAAILAF